MSSRFCPVIFQLTVTFPRPGAVLITWKCKISPASKMYRLINAQWKMNKHLNSTKPKSQTCNFYSTIFRTLQSSSVLNFLKALHMLIVYLQRDLTSKYCYLVELQEVWYVNVRKAHAKMGNTNFYTLQNMHQNIKVL